MNSKQEEKIKKGQEKREKRFLKVLGLKKDASQTEINEKTLEYAKNVIYKKGVGGIYKIVLLDFQQNDPEFMLKLYETNPAILYLYRPNQQFRQNLNFMLNYFEIYINSESNVEYTMKKLGEHYRELMKNPIFIQLLFKKYENINALKIIDSSIDHWSMSAGKKNEILLGVINDLQDSFLNTQAQRFGKEFLKYLPRKHSNYLKLLESAIECDGFESLKYLNVDQVLANKNLIIKACRGEGCACLTEYINKTLSPNREISYMCHGELHGYSHYDKRYEEVQKALLNDSEIQGYLYPPAKREESYIDKILKGAKLLVDENPEIVENITNSASTRFGEELKHE